LSAASGLKIFSRRRFVSYFACFTGSRHGHNSQTTGQSTQSTMEQTWQWWKYKSCIKNKNARCL